jgi:uncharacterized membrane protein
MRRLSISCRIYLALVAFSILGSAISKYAVLDAGLIKPFASGLTLLFGVHALFQTMAKAAGVWKAAGAILLVISLGTAVEVCSLYTGLPFGRYEYTTNWQPILDLPGGKRFPLLLPLAWFLVAGSTSLMFNRNRWSPILFIALVATAIDAAMEAVMTGPLAYWRWIDRGPLPGEAPWSNSAGWLATSSLATGLIYSLIPKKSDTFQPRVVLGAYAVLLVALAIIYLPNQ